MKARISTCSQESHYQDKTPKERSCTVRGEAGHLRHSPCQGRVQGQTLSQHRPQLSAEDAVQRDLEDTPRLLRVHMLNHSSPHADPQGFDTAGYFPSKQPPIPFLPQPDFPGCSSVGLGKHCRYLPQRAGLLPSGTAAPLIP